MTTGTVKKALGAGLLWAAITLLFCAAVIALAGKLRAQERDQYQQWIHENRADCCDHRDCAPADVAMTFTGWQVKGTDNVVPFAQVVKWPFAVPYACIGSRWGGGRYARCLFMSEGG